jgi:hypothetical protein
VLLDYDSKDFTWDYSLARVLSCISSQAPNIIPITTDMTSPNFRQIGSLYVFDPQDHRLFQKMSLSWSFRKSVSSNVQS